MPQLGHSLMVKHSACMGFISSMARRRGGRGGRKRGRERERGCGREENQEQLDLWHLPCVLFIPTTSL